MQVAINKHLSKNGFSLVEVLVALGLLSIAAMVLMEMNVTNMKANKSSRIRAELLDLKRTINNRLSCDQTLGAVRPTTCSGSVALKDKNGNLFVNNGKIGDWNIEATCESLGTPSMPGLSIYATQIDKKDPLTKLPLDRNNPISSLFQAELRPCADNFNPGSSLTAACIIAPASLTHYCGIGFREDSSQLCASLPNCGFKPWSVNSNGGFLCCPANTLYGGVVQEIRESAYGHNGGTISVIRSFTILCCRQ